MKEIDGTNIDWSQFRLPHEDWRDYRPLRGVQLPARLIERCEQHLARVTGLWAGELGKPLLMVDKRWSRLINDLIAAGLMAMLDDEGLRERYLLRLSEKRLASAKGQAT
jgi:hypothetical protein